MEKTLINFVKILRFILVLSILILITPLWIIFSIIIIIETRQFPIFTQLRSTNLNTKSFKIYKFRTIKKHNENDLDNNIFKKDYLSQYVGSFGAFLRRTGLDELPQLFNVLKGEMNLVGIRPFSIPDLELMRKNFPEQYEEKEKISVKAGITGYWQIFGNRDEGIPNLINSEKFYEQNKNSKLDLKILISTLPVVLLGRQSDAIVFISEKRKKIIKTIIQTQE